MIERGDDLGAPLRDRAGRASPQARSGLGHSATITSADDGWTCVQCGHRAWRFRLASDRLIECNSCGAIHTFSSVLEARKYRDLDRYYRLLFAVEKKYPGEERHETALRYIREREAGAAQGTEARRAETGTGSVHDGPVAESDAPETAVQDTPEPMPDGEH